MSDDRAAALQEAMRRGLLSPEKSAALAEAQKRGLVQQQPTGEQMEAQSLGPEVTVHDAFWHGMTHAAGSTMQGVGQLAAHLMHSTGMVGDAFVERSDREAREFEEAHADKEEARQHPWAYAGGRIAGDIAVTTPLMAVPGLGAASMMGRLATGTAIGAGMGMLQPVVEGQDDYYTEKLWQGLKGAPGGLVGGVAGEAIVSPLARAIARKDTFTLPAFKETVGRSRRMTSDTTLSRQDDRILTTIDQIIVDKRNLQLVDPRTGGIVTGQLPKTLKQFSEAIEQVKRRVYAGYDGMLQRAAATTMYHIPNMPQGGVVDLQMIADDIRKMVGTSAYRLLSPDVKRGAEALATRLERQGGATLVEAQDLVQHLNRRTDAFWRAGKNPARDTTEMAGIEATVAEKLRDQIDTLVTRLEGPGYQELRDTYAAIKAVEANVARAVDREAGRVPGGKTGQFFSHAYTASKVGLGILTGHPHSILTGLSWVGGRAYAKWADSPHRTIENLFKYREKVVHQNVSQLRQVARRVAETARPVAVGVGGIEAGRQRPDTLEMLDQPGGQPVR